MSTVDDPHSFTHRFATVNGINPNFTDMRDIMVMPGVGHTPPEERPDEINEILLKFLKDIGH